MEWFSWNSLLWTLFGAFLGFFGSIIANSYTPRVLFWWKNNIKLNCSFLKTEPIFNQENNIYTSICSYVIDEYKFSELVKLYLCSDKKKEINEAIITNIQMPLWYFYELRKETIFCAKLDELEILSKDIRKNFLDIKRKLNELKDEFYNNVHDKFPHQKSIFAKELSTIRYNFFQINFDAKGNPIKDKDLTNFVNQNSLISVLIFEKIFGNSIFASENKIQNLILPPNHHNIKKSFSSVKGTDSILLIKGKKMLPSLFTRRKTVLYYDDEIYMLNYQTIGKSDSLKDGFFQRVLAFKENIDNRDYLVFDFKNILLAYNLTENQIIDLMN